jgi:gamma-polyglutamate synthase
MTGVEVLAVITGSLVCLGVVELALHRRRLGKIPIRIHVNGTRGKSSVTRLIAAGLRAGGIRTCAKTTGTTARFILPDARELPIYRPAGANIIEQKRIVAVAAAHEAEALVIECMALQPLLQSLSELELVRATHGVITNARPDHLDVMGPDAERVAHALAGTTPARGKLFTAEKARIEVFRRAASDRQSVLVEAPPLEELVDDRDEALAGFAYTEHADNVALALAVCADLGVKPRVALEGMWAGRPDPGAMTERHLDFFGRSIVFVNGFAANDPVSTEQIWRMALDRHDHERRIAIFNCRADRPERSAELGRAFVEWEPPDHVVLMGSGTFLFAESAVKAGFDAAKIDFAEGLGAEGVFERVVALAGPRALVMGMGNTAGAGLELVEYFSNRAAPALPNGPT